MTDPALQAQLQAILADLQKQSDAAKIAIAGANKELNEAEKLLSDNYIRLERLEQKRDDLLGDYKAYIACVSVSEGCCSSPATPTSIPPQVPISSSQPAKAAAAANVHKVVDDISDRGQAAVHEKEFFAQVLPKRSQEFFDKIRQKVSGQSNVMPQPQQGMLLRDLGNLQKQYQQAFSDLDTNRTKPKGTYDCNQLKATLSQAEQLFWRSQGATSVAATVL